MINFLLVFVIFSVPDIGLSNKCAVVSYSCLICISLMTYGWEHLFICLFTICISFSVSCPIGQLANVFNHVVCFLIIEFYELFVYLGKQSFIRCDSYKDFLPVYGLSSHSLDIVFCRSDF